MKEQMKPSMRKKPDHIILHIGTKDLKSDRVSDLVAKSIIDLAITMKSNSQNSFMTEAVII